MDFSQLFMDNPTYLYMLFGGSLFLLLLIYIIVKVVSSKKKKGLRSQGDLAELEFDQPVRLASRVVTDVQFMGYKVFSVNGAQPSIVERSIFVPEGTCCVELQYFDTEYATRKSSLTTVYEKQLLEFDVKGNQKYRITFDEKSENISVK